MTPLCASLGADTDDLLPFSRYAAAAQGLQKSSSAARALDNGQAFIERVDLPVKAIASQKGLSDPSIDEIVNTTDLRLAKNRMRQAS